MAAPVLGESTVVADPVLGEEFFSGGSGHLGVKRSMVYIQGNFEKILGWIDYIKTLQTEGLTDFTWSVRLSRRKGWVLTRLR